MGHSDVVHVHTPRTHSICWEGIIWGNLEGVLLSIHINQIEVPNKTIYQSIINLYTVQNKEDNKNKAPPKKRRKKTRKTKNLGQSFSNRGRYVQSVREHKNHIIGISYLNNYFRCLASQGIGPGICLVGILTPPH